MMVSVTKFWQKWGPCPPSWIWLPSFGAIFLRIPVKLVLAIRKKKENTKYRLRWICSGVIIQDSQYQTYSKRFTDNAFVILLACGIDGELSFCLASKVTCGYLVVRVRSKWNLRALIDRPSTCRSHLTLIIDDSWLVWQRDVSSFHVWGPFSRSGLLTFAD